VLASSWRGLPNDVYFQIGLLTVLGLTTKNAILIVQFAQGHLEQGMGLVEATIQGAKLRLRPIVMTSLAFGFGVLRSRRRGGRRRRAGGHRHERPRRHGHRHVPGDLLHPLFYVFVVRVFAGRRPRRRGRTRARLGGALVMQRRLDCLIGGVALALALGGCALAPAYVRPPSPVPPRCPRDTAAGAPRATEVAWQQYFTDGAPPAVIEQALAKQPRPAMATLNIERAQAFYRSSGPSCSRR